MSGREHIDVGLVLILMGTRMAAWSDADVVTIFADHAGIAVDDQRAGVMRGHLSPSPQRVGEEKPHRDRREQEADDDDHAAIRPGFSGSSSNAAKLIA